MQIQDKDISFFTRLFQDPWAIFTACVSAIVAVMWSVKNWASWQTTVTDTYLSLNKRVDSIFKNLEEARREAVEVNRQRDEADRVFREQHRKETSDFQKEMRDTVADLNSNIGTLNTKVAILMERSESGSNG